MRVLSVISVLSFLSAPATWAAPAPPPVTAESALLVDAATGKVLYEKRCRTRRPPASTTKMMTAIVILENGDLHDTVEASKYACETRYGSLHLKPGETLKMQDLLHAILMRSANDGAVCAAEHIAGSEGKFVEMMNEKAKEIGCRDTHFVNPHGLQDPEHYSTAYDLALIARYATRFPQFNDIVRTLRARISRSMNSKDVTLRNTARFLSRYKGADGIKTGYTKEAGRCFVGSATRDKWRIVSVVLKSKNAEQDTSALLNYAYKYFKSVSFARLNEVAATVPVAGGTEPRLDLVATDHLALVVPRSEAIETRVYVDVKRVSAPVNKGEKVGTLTGWVNGRKLGTVDLLAASSVERTFLATVWACVWACARTLLAVTVIFIVGLLTYGTAVAKAARRRRRRLASGSGKADNLRTRSRQWQRDN